MKTAQSTLDVAKPRRRMRAGAERLMEAGERLFGHHGLDGATMQQIRNEAGSSNKYAVQYHFGGIDGLIAAILETRMPSVDAAQAEMLVTLLKEGRQNDIHALIGAFFRPLVGQVNSQGEPTYARFMSAMLVSPDGPHHFETMMHLAPTTNILMQHLHSALPELPEATLHRRIRLLTVMVCTDLYTTETRPDKLDRMVALEDTLRMVAVALSSSPN